MMKYLIVLACLFVAACGGDEVVRPVGDGHASEVVRPDCPNISDGATTCK